MCEEVEEAIVVAGTLSPERAALPPAAKHGDCGHLVEVGQAPVGEVGVAAQHAAPELGLVTRGEAPGTAHLVGAHHDLDLVVEPVEDAGFLSARWRPPPLLAAWARDTPPVGQGHPCSASRALLPSSGSRSRRHRSPTTALSFSSFHFSPLQRQQLAGASS